MTKGYLAAYDQGYAAYPAQKESDNPYPWGTIPHNGWKYGWLDARLINSRSETLYPLTTTSPPPEKISKTT